MEDAFDVQRDHLALMKDFETSAACRWDDHVPEQQTWLPYGSRRPGETGTESTRNYAKTLSQDFARNRQIHNCRLDYRSLKGIVMSLISMHGAWLSFSDAPLLDNAELHIEDNERVCLVGRNGAGKSTLMKILNREQGLDDGRIIYEQDLIVARLQQDPSCNVEGSVYDFVAEGIEEQAEYLKRYHDISRLVMNDPSEKNLNELAKVQEQLDHHNLWQLENRINEGAGATGIRS